MSEETPFRKLPDSQVFDRDPEQWDKESIEDAIVRLRAVVTKHRSARGLSMDCLAQEKAAKVAKKRPPAKAKAATPKAKRGSSVKVDAEAKGADVLDSPPFE